MNTQYPTCTEVSNKGIMRVCVCVTSSAANPAVDGAEAQSSGGKKQPNLFTRFVLY